MPGKTHQIRLENVRLSFPVLFTARAMATDPDSKPKYSASFLLDPSNKAHAKQLDAITKLIDECAAEKWPRGVPKSVKKCLQDGNEKDYDGYENMMFIHASESRRPATVDAARNPVSDSDGVLYAGCFVNAIVSFWAQDNTWGKRVNASLRGVQFTRDGDAFGVDPIDPETEFDDLSGDDNDDGLLD